MPKKTARRSRNSDADIERLVNLLAELSSTTEGVSASVLTEKIKWTHRHVRARLRELEDMGHVFRTGERNETRWFLG